MFMREGEVMQFKSPEYLLFLLLLLPVGIVLFRKREGLGRYFDKTVLQKLQLQTGIVSVGMKSAILLLAMALMVLALARPYVDHGEVKVRSSTIDIVVGFDISKSMFANDVYPSRLALAKKKFKSFADDLEEAKIGVIGFSSRAFLISPLTEDFNTLEYLVGNMNTDYISLRGTSIMNALEVTAELMKEGDKKALLLFTDGGDKSSFDEEISYAKEHGIVLYIYNIGTEKGGVISTENGALTDENGDIVVVRLNDAIKELALKSGGAYMKYSLKHNDIKALADAVKSHFQNSKKEGMDTIHDVKELFIYPLAAAIVLLFAALYSLPFERRRNV
jgi:Ca-activated chloride channel family protein